jgi:hypothetical protein
MITPRDRLLHRKAINPHNIRGSFGGSAIDLINSGIELLRQNGVPEEVLAKLRDLIKRITVSDPLGILKQVRQHYAESRTSG